jgi:hypothetical protein
MDFKELKNALLKEIMDKKIKQPTDEFNVDRLLFFIEIARNAIIAIKEEGEFLNVKRTEDKNHNGNVIPFLPCYLKSMTK